MMKPKRRGPINSNSSSGLNFRPSNPDSKIETRGTVPTTAPSTVKEIFTLMVLHCCKKSMFFNTNLKVLIYLAALFLVSLIADFITVPRSYMSRSDNAFNRFFVKFAWGWNLLLLVPYVLLTSYVYCCGQRNKILKHHVARLAVATFFWWFWTTLFNVIEAAYGRCSVRSEQLNTKQTCLQAGYIWNGLDLSGHSFILIYGSLVLIEETRSMVNWDSIKEHMRLEEHYRATKDTTQNTNPLAKLNNDHFRHLQEAYEKYTPYIRSIFIAITLFQIMWDVMLITTILYYHIMIEKLLGGIIAIFTWYFTYNLWFSSPSLLPKLPGEGEFKYIKPKAAVQNPTTTRRRTGSIVNGSQIPVYMSR